MADAVGTQTEAVVIRGISVGVPVRHVVARELTSGLIIGVLIAAVFFPFAYFVWGNEHVAATVALALFASTATATGVAMVLPYALDRLGRDPAFGAGPFGTVIQDLLSIIILLCGRRRTRTVGAVTAWRRASEEMGPRPDRPARPAEASLA
jgi:magnesium transporter